MKYLVSLKILFFGICYFIVWVNSQNAFGSPFIDDARFMQNIENDQVRNYSDRERNAKAIAKANFAIGKQYLEHYELVKSYEFFYTSKRILEDNNLKNTNLYALTLSKLGFISYQCANYKSALFYMKSWYVHPKIYDDRMASAMNTLALCLHANGYDQEAIRMYQKTYAFASTNDKQWMGIVLVNMANVMNKLSRWVIEEQLMLAGIKLCKQHKVHEYLPGSITYLLMLRGKKGIWDDFEILYDEAIAHSDTAHAYMGFHLKEHPDVFEVRSLFHKFKGDYKSAMLDFEEAKIRRNTIDEDNKEFDLLTKEFNLNIAELEVKINANDFEIKKSSRFVFIIVAIFSITLILGYYRIKKIKKKSIQDRTLYETRRNQVQEELKLAKLKLNQLENDKNVSLANKKNVHHNESQELNAEFDQSVLLNFRFSTDEDWLLYKNLFNQFYPLYQQRLIQDFPAITDGELRMACLHRLNLKNEQMADMLGISKDSLRKTNQRLREKLNIKEQVALIDYLFTIPT